MSTEHRYFVFLLVLCVAAIPVAAMTGALGIKTPTEQSVRGLLQTLFVIALFVERSIQVFIVAWRGPKDAELESGVRAASRALKDLKLGTPNSATLYEKLKTDLDAAKLEQNIFQAKTDRIRLCAALAIGILIAAAGVRSLEVFVHLRTANTNGWEHFAGMLLNSLNVVITGGLIGGGSELIQGLLKIIADFLKTSAELIRQRLDRAGE